MGATRPTTKLAIPSSLHPLLRAYLLGHLTSTGPRLFGFLRVITRKDLSFEKKISILFSIIKTSTQINRFPTACAVIVGGATALPKLVISVLQWLLVALQRSNNKISEKATSRIRFVTTFLSAYVTFNIMNSDSTWSRKRAQSIALRQAQIQRPDPSAPFSSLDYPNQHHFPNPPPESSLPSQSYPQYAGKTIDFTLLAFVRALDALVVNAWTSTLSSSPLHPSHSHPRISSILTMLADPLVFSSSAAIIMFSWFYSPERLPKSYNKWLSAAAALDIRLLEALRRARRGEFLYGVETGQAPLLGGLAEELGMKRVRGDPANTVPVPCELYHCDNGKGPLGFGLGCERHAVRRWLRGWTFAMKVYGPVQFLARLSFFISKSNTLDQKLAMIVSTLQAAAMQSSFLATFISLFYYGVCLARTRLGPYLFPHVGPQAWDSGLCVLSGCLTCGWSVLLEKAERRGEVAMFVAPRALATVLPRVYDKKLQSRERLIFATSVAFVLNAVIGGSSSNNNNKKKKTTNVVRGVLGKILQGVLREGSS